MTRKRRAFSAECKQQAVRRVREREAAVVSLVASPAVCGDIDVPRAHRLDDGYDAARQRPLSARPVR